MFKAITKGYGAALLIGIAGYFAVGGPLWAWALLVWIGGAPVTLFFVEPQKEDDTVEDAPAIARNTRSLLWLIPGFGKTRLDDGS